ncbi:HNH endonuclease [Streptomyces sp. MNU76]|uniref:HNH endonuclease signature motif containing protein n=1 Tax=Streptomyces sp. MNU76 TaxID=2560026 RepID=UPI001E592F6C|nr:HNH endonuclease [Streptomyces sp. MNU76]MCC9703909.1 HNH endonuclease [Streptomyces sp. MNU76]
MGDSVYSEGRLSPAVAEARNWNDLMRRLGLKTSGGQRRVLQEKVARHGLDTSHFVKRSPWRKYPDAAIVEATATSSSLREVALKLGATPATGTLSHIRRRIDAAGIDISHFPGIDRVELDLPFTTEELKAATVSADSVRGVARALGVPDDSRSRATLLRMLRERHIDTEHFTHTRVSLDEEALRTLVPQASSYADVMRGLGLVVSYTNHRRVQRAAARLGLDTSHFKRRTWGKVDRRAPTPTAHRVLVVLPPDAGRTNRAQLHRALTEIGVPYTCMSCGNTGEWLGRSITLQIDHINGDWHDNRRENLRYLCPNCHALTDTWCRQKERTSLAG